jgi:hypothetical protein
MTLHTPQLADFSQEDRAILKRVAKRMGRTPEALLDPSIMGVQAHGPPGSKRIIWKPTRHTESRESYPRSPRRRFTWQFR